MKIINQNGGEMVLKEGGASGVVSGVMFIVIGAVVEFYFSTSGPVAVWVGVGMMVAGLVAVLFSSSIAIDISKASGQFSYRKKRLIGGSSGTYSIANVLRIETRKSWRIQSGPRQNAFMQRQVLISQSVIVFKDGHELPLDHRKSSSGVSIGPIMMGGKGNEVAIATQVANFMGVPFVEIAPPASGMEINTGGSDSIQL